YSSGKLVAALVQRPAQNRPSLYRGCAGSGVGESSFRSGLGVRRNRKYSKNRGESEQRARVHRLPCLRKRNPKLPVGQWQTILQGVGRTPAWLGQIYKHNGDMMAKNHLLMLAATKKLHFP